MLAVYESGVGATTDLSAEIELWRARAKHFQELKDNGVTEHEYTLANGARVYAIDELLNQATRMLKELAVAQNHMHPESKDKGQITVTVKVQGGKLDPGETPNLEADAEQPVSDGPAPLDPLDSEPRGQSLADELGLDEDA